MTGFSWRQLGAFVYTGADLSDDQLDRFAQAGGRYLLPVIYGDSVAGPWNIANLKSLGQRASSRGLRVGAWVSCHGEDPAVVVGQSAAVIDSHALAPIVFDAESEYQGNTKLSMLTLEARKKWPVGTKAIAVTTNSLNDSVVWNGRKGSTLEKDAHSLRELHVHVLPQWYNAPRYIGSCWAHPVCNMDWLEHNGMLDNFRSPTFPDGRAVDLAHVHGAVEATGVEDADLAGELKLCKLALPFGCGKGIVLYTLERAPADDFDVLAGYRNTLYV